MLTLRPKGRDLISHGHAAKALAEGTLANNSPYEFGVKDVIRGIVLPHLQPIIKLVGYHVATLLVLR
jgi:hypothetical protein